MMRSRLDSQLLDLKKELIVMGSLCENAIARSAKALLEKMESRHAELTALLASLQ